METAGQSFGGGVKWAAVGVLSAAAVGGLALALFFRQPREALSRGMPPKPQETAPHTVPHADPQTAPAPPVATTAEPGRGVESSTPTPPAPKPAPKPTPSSATPGKLNINTATAAELELLPGIGPELAQRIIAHRAEHGSFTTLKDLDGVRGIGPKILKKLETLVAFE